MSILEIHGATRCQEAPQLFENLLRRIQGNSGTAKGIGARTVEEAVTSRSPGAAA